MIYLSCCGDIAGQRSLFFLILVAALPFPCSYTWEAHTWGHLVMFCPSCVSATLQWFCRCAWAWWPPSHDPPNVDTKQCSSCAHSVAPLLFCAPALLTLEDCFLLAWPMDKLWSWKTSKILHTQWISTITSPTRSKPQHWRRAPSQSWILCLDIFPQPYNTL